MLLNYRGIYIPLLYNYYSKCHDVWHKKLMIDEGVYIIYEKIIPDFSVCRDVVSIYKSLHEFQSFVYTK